MEGKLNRLFDYQRFENNARLRALIQETEDRCGRALSDEDLAMVNAAGDMLGSMDNVKKPGARPGDSET